MGIWIVLPAYNEAVALPRLLARLDRLPESSPELFADLRFLVVDDGSSDATAEIARLWPRVRVARHERNLGLGQALLTGLVSALADPAASLVITMDADDTAGAEVVVSLATRALQGADVVIASRYRPGAVVTGVPLGRRAISRAASWLCHLTFRYPGVRDYTSGFRAYSRSFLASALSMWADRLVTSHGVACQLELLWKGARSAGGTPRFAEVPLVLHYDRKPGRSKLNLLPAAREALAWALRPLLPPNGRVSTPPCIPLHQQAQPRKGPGVKGGAARL